ncbi:MAG: hypothetical protein NTW87_13805, partial [Planctomycetota bacterium]|nr:hypothetical protein [Planctomycetota bacterium]
TTHDMAEAEQLCDRIAILNKGRIALVDTPDGLRRRSTRGPVLTLRLRLDGRAGKDEEFVRATLLAAAPGAGVDVDGEADKLRQDGLTTFVVHTRCEPGSSCDGYATPKVLWALSDRGLPLMSLTVEEPSLEDAFVEILGTEGKEASA